MEKKKVRKKAREREREGHITLHTHQEDPAPPKPTPGTIALFSCTLSVAYSRAGLRDSWTVIVYLHVLCKPEWPLHRQGCVEIATLSAVRLQADC